MKTVSGQVIFSEPFDEANTSVTGLDNTGGVSWTAACSTCTTGDYFYVNSNVLECEDTNGPGTWTSGTINTSVCTSGLTLSMDFDLSGASNPFEECAAGCGCTCVDWISVEYNANGAGFIPLSSVQGGTCSQTCSGGTYVLLGALSAGLTFNYSTCLPACNTLQLRVSVQTWANGEKYRIDNISVACSTCALPIELVSFDATPINGIVELNWTTSTEINNDYFTVERSADGHHFEPVSVMKGSGTSNKLKTYTDKDPKPLDAEVSYYRLKQTDFDDSFTYSKMIAVGRTKTNGDPGFMIMPNPSVNGLFTLISNTGGNESMSVEIIDNTGKKISETILNERSLSIDLSAYTKGLYLIRITEGSRSANYRIIYQ